MNSYGHGHHGYRKHHRVKRHYGHYGHRWGGDWGGKVYYKKRYYSYY